MKIRFDCFDGDEIVNAYLDFVKKRNSKEVYLKYFSDKYGFREMMEGRLQINDVRLKELSKKIRFVETSHELELYQKDWKIKFCLNLYWEPNADSLGTATLSFDESLKKEVYNHFKEFKPIKTK